MAAATNPKSKPRLKNLDDLFSLNDHVNPLEKALPIMDTQPAGKRAVVSLKLDKLTPFSGHPFRLYEGEQLDDMVESIKANGVLVPIIVRRIIRGDSVILEILAGHNRVNASKIAGLTEINAIVLENISDEDAMVYVIETNLIQRSFSDMAHSEKAAVIALHHSKMFSQGKRNDILEQLEMLANPHNNKENQTFAEIRRSESMRESVAKAYSLKPNQVALYLRIQQLITSLRERLDRGEYALSVAANLSFLKEAEQTAVNDCIERNNLSVDMKKSDALRKFTNKGRLDSESIYRILSGNMEHKPNRTPTVKIGKDVYSRYFKPNQSAKEVQGIIEKALEAYFMD